MNSKVQGKLRHIIIGERFGNLVVLGRDIRPNTNTRYVLVKCDCGVKKFVIFTNIYKGLVTNCNCKKDIDKDRQINKIKIRKMSDIEKRKTERFNIFSRNKF
jgi:hypothetical protein